MSNNKRITFTGWMMQQGLSRKGTLNAKQFRALGYKRPFKGWKKIIVGNKYTRGQIKTFISLKGDHLKKKTLQKANTTTYPGTSGPKPPNPYKTVEWAELRERILERDKFRCVACCAAGGTLYVHHLLYESGKEIWEVPDYYLVSLCKRCHAKEHSLRLSPPRKIF